MRARRMARSMCGVRARLVLARRTGVGVLMLAGVTTVAMAQRAQSPTATTPAPLVFDKVTVVDVEHGKLLPDQRVVVVGTRIQAMGRASNIKLPPAAHVVDARGKYLIPGLWDMHAHTDRAPGIYTLLVANGVTGIREMTSEWPEDFDLIRRQRGEIARGALLGPRIVATSHDFVGPMCGGSFPVAAADTSILREAAALLAANCSDSGAVRTPEEIRRFVDTLKAGGVDFVKAHTISDPKVYFAFLAEARRVGIPAVGHLGGAFGRAVTEIEASDSGLRSIEHLPEMGCWQKNWDSWVNGEASLPDSLMERQCAAVAKRLRHNGTWIVPTMYVLYHSNMLNMQLDFEAPIRALGALHRFGAPILAGSDAIIDPGQEKQPLESALHEELALLVKAGLTPVEALRAATLNPAKFFGSTDSLGTVASGKLADLVLLDADPLADIANTRKIGAVVANGRYFDRAALDKLVAEAHANLLGAP